MKGVIRSGESTENYHLNLQLRAQNVTVLVDSRGVVFRQQQAAVFSEKALTTKCILQKNHYCRFNQDHDLFLTSRSVSAYTTSGYCRFAFSINIL